MSESVQKLELDGRVYLIDDLGDESKVLLGAIQEANELLKIKEVEAKHVAFSRECALEKLRTTLADVPSTEAEAAEEAAE